MGTLFGWNFAGGLVAWSYVFLTFFGRADSTLR